MFSPIRIYKEENTKKETPTGIVIKFSDKYNSEVYEKVSLLDCQKFSNKHQLKDTSLKNVGKEMIKFFNKGLRPHDNKRKLMCVYYMYEGTYYSSKEL